MTIRAYTSIISNYLPKALILAESLKRFNPEIEFWLVMPQTDAPPVDLTNTGVDHVMTLDGLGIPDQDGWVFKHTIVEASTAVKGKMLEHLLALPDTEAVFYFDPDIVIFHPLQRLIAEFDRASILLTPHQTLPEETTAAILDNEISMLIHGIYNLGFVGVKNSAEGNRFARFWSSRLIDYCYDDKPRGIFTDQAWCDFVPAYFDEVKVLRDPVYNVCTWNLTHRTVAGTFPDAITANGQDLIFYHFSGFDSGAQLLALDKWAQQMPILYTMRDWYLAESDRRGQQQLGKVPWQYGVFDDGTPVTKDQRWLYRERADLQAAFPHPLQTADAGKSYLAWWNAGGHREMPDANPAIRTTQNELAAIRNSRSWQLAQKIQKVALRLPAPLRRLARGAFAKFI